VSYLTRIGNISAMTLSEFLAGLEYRSDASIFHHTFQTLSIHHFLTEGFSNDFAQWVLAGTNRDALAEQLAALDIRDYFSLAALRADLCMVVRDFCEQHPEFANQSLWSPFISANRWKSLFLWAAPPGLSTNFAKAFPISAMPVSISTSFPRACGFSSAPTISPTGSRMVSGS
jgi:hypothetical protein